MIVCSGSRTSAVRFVEYRALYSPRKGATNACTTTRCFGNPSSEQGEDCTGGSLIRTSFGCTIKTRIGLHEVTDDFCSGAGLILLEMFGDPARYGEFANLVNGFDGVEAQKMVFGHDWIFHGVYSKGQGGEPDVQKKKRWQCLVCGYIHDGDAPPKICPVCGVDSSRFIAYR